MSTFISLHCAECENCMCGLGNHYVPDGSLEGCTRKVSEDTAARYYHYFNELWPMIYCNHTKYKKDYIWEVYHEIINFLNQEIYSAPIGVKLDSRGKTKSGAIVD